MRKPGCGESRWGSSRGVAPSGDNSEAKSRAVARKGLLWIDVEPRQGEVATKRGKAVAGVGVVPLSYDDNFFFFEKENFINIGKSTAIEMQLKKFYRIENQSLTKSLYKNIWKFSTLVSSHKPVLTLMIFHDTSIVSSPSKILLFFCNQMFHIVVIMTIFTAEIHLLLFFTLTVKPNKTYPQLCPPSPM